MNVSRWLSSHSLTRSVATEVLHRFGLSQNRSASGAAVIAIALHQTIILEKILSLRLPRLILLTLIRIAGLPPWLGRSRSHIAVRAVLLIMALHQTLHCTRERVEVYMASAFSVKPFRYPATAWLFSTAKSEEICLVEVPFRQP